MKSYLNSGSTFTNKLHDLENNIPNIRKIKVKI